MPSQTIEVREWTLKQLAERHPGTAAGLLPLVAQVEEIGEIDVRVEHRHLDFTALMVVRKGQGIHQIAGNQYGISRGDVYVMGPGVSHQWFEFDHLVLDSFYFQMKLFDNDTQDALRETPGFLSLFVNEQASVDESSRRWLHLSPDQHSTVELEMAELRLEWGRGSRLGAQISRGLVVRLLAHLANMNADSRIESSAPRNEATPGERPRSPSRESTVAATIRYLDSHFDEHVSIEHLAGSVFMSASRLRQIFSDVMGRSPVDYLRHLRIERAKVLLSSTDLNVTEISKQAGFGDPVYFSRVFRMETGETPSDYRRTHSVKSRSGTTYP